MPSQDELKAMQEEAAKLRAQADTAKRTERDELAAVEGDILADALAAEIEIQKARLQPDSASDDVVLKAREKASAPTPPPPPAPPAPKPAPDKTDK